MMLAKVMRPYLFLFFLFLVACVGMGEERGVSRMGVGVGLLERWVGDFMSDMRLFFSKQLVFDPAEACPIRVVLDSQRLENESAERINFDVIVRAIREHLGDPRNAEKLSLAGRSLIFIDERRRVVAGQAGPLADRPACRLGENIGADYLLAGRVVSDDKISGEDIRERQTLVTFWLLDLETSAKVWTSPPYIFKSYGQNDVVYR